MYNRLPANGPSGSKHVDDSINKNISLEKVNFVGLYCIIVSQSQLQFQTINFIVRKCYMFRLFHKPFIRHWHKSIRNVPDVNFLE
jgi:hypothetical protein